VTVKASQGPKPSSTGQAEWAAKLSSIAWGWQTSHGFGCLQPTHLDAIPVAQRYVGQ
jgi:hypothetical protein